MPLVAWILSLVGPIVIRAVLALGFSAVSFAAVTTICNQLISIAQNNWSLLPVVVLQLASLSGVPQALGMLFAAWVARVSLWAAVNGTKYIFSK